MHSDKIIKKLTEAVKSDNAVAITLAMTEMMKQDRDLTFHSFHLALRHMNSDVYLVAKPWWTTVLGCRDLKGAEAWYYLWICLHGREEYLHELAAIGITEGQNHEYLKECGVLTI